MLTTSASACQLPPYLRTSSAKGKKKSGAMKSGLKTEKKSKEASRSNSRNVKIPLGSKSTAEATAKTTTAPSNSNEPIKSQKNAQATNPAETAK